LTTTPAPWNIWKTLKWVVKAVIVRLAVSKPAVSSSDHIPLIESRP
jgi:hypothetical protein